jgi:hypothetical protein
MVTNGRIRTAALVVLALASTSAWSQTVSAQVPASTNPELRTGRRVWVTQADGSVIEGKIASVSDTALGVSSDQTVKSLPWRSVRVVEAKDSLGNGLMLGVLIGAGGGALGGILTNVALCYEGCNSEDEAAVVLGSVLTGLMFAVPISLLVDHAHNGRQTIYRPSAQVSVGPTLGRGKLGVGAVVRW